MRTLELDVYCIEVAVVVELCGCGFGLAVDEALSLLLSVFFILSIFLFVREASSAVYAWGLPPTSLA